MLMPAQEGGPGIMRATRRRGRTGPLRQGPLSRPGRTRHIIYIIMCNGHPPAGAGSRSDAAVMCCVTTVAVGQRFAKGNGLILVLLSVSECLPGFISVLCSINNIPPWLALHM
jgi:hypothetical protein